MEHSNEKKKPFSRPCARQHIIFDYNYIQPGVHILDYASLNQFRRSLPSHRWMPCLFSACRLPVGGQTALRPGMPSLMPFN